VIKQTTVCDECAAVINQGRDEFWCLADVAPSPFTDGPEVGRLLHLCSADCLMAAATATARLAGLPVDEDAA
jgi:hypothetical protein